MENACHIKELEELWNWYFERLFWQKEKILEILVKDFVGFIDFMEF